VDDQTPAEQNAAQPNAGLPPTSAANPVDPKAAVRPAAQQLAEVEREMSGFEKATLRWTKTAVFMSFIAAFFVCAQWWEMHEGGRDTHDLAIAAGTQANRMQEFSDRMKDQADRTRDLADRMKDQADRTKDLADQARVQATEATIAANAAESAAQTEKEALHVSERAYLTLGTPVDNFAHKETDVPILNSGHIPSGAATLVMHEATFGNINPSNYLIPISGVVERHWVSSIFQAVPVGTPYSVAVSVPALVLDDISNGKQGVLIVIVMTYNDGFPSTPEQRWVWCDVSNYIASTKQFSMGPCAQNPEEMLQVLTKLDGYPDPKYKQPD
jgi:hypothetical protein